MVSLVSSLCLFDCHGFARILTFVIFWRQTNWEDRFSGDVGAACLDIVDGTDFQIYEPKSPLKKWYSHKFNGAGLCYEVAINIQMGCIVWIHGPFPCGSFNDLTIFCGGLMHIVYLGDILEADNGYHGKPTKICIHSEPGVSENQFIAKS